MQRFPLFPNFLCLERKRDNLPENKTESKNIQSENNTNAQLSFILGFGKKYSVFLSVVKINIIYNES